MVHMNIRSWGAGTPVLQDELEKISEKNICIVGGI
jgi:hypothetical protein